MLSFGEKEFYKELLIEKRNKIGKIMRNIMVPLTIITCLSYPSVRASVKNYYSNKKNKSNIDEYNNSINQYAQEINEKNYNELDTIVKITDDYYKNKTKLIDGKSENYNFERLDIFKNNQGSYASVADDVAAKLNKIDTKYNANAVIVQYEEIYANPDKTFAQFITPPMLKDNHEVVFANVKNNVVLIDVPNDIIGVVKDGNILLYGDDAKYKIKINYFDNYLDGGFEQLKKAKNVYAKSFDNNKSEEELEKSFGIEAQEQSKQKVKTIR